MHRKTNEGDVPNHSTFLKRRIIEAGRTYSNTVHLHSSLGGLARAEFISRFPPPPCA